jgi:CelD/BcsL family acetyltransferase involved in cellulose biosynthesis
MMTRTVLSDWEELQGGPLEEEWGGLVERSAADEIFARAEWLRAWGVSRTREAEPRILLLRDGGRLVGIAPLMRARKKFLGVELETLEFAGTPHSDYSDFIYEEPRYLEELWGFAREEARGVDVVRLQQVRRESATRGFLERQDGMIARLCGVGLYTRLPEEGAPAEAYLKGRGLRKRTLLRIERAGEVRLIRHTGWREIAARLPVLFDQHIRRWERTRTRSFFLKEATRELYVSWAKSLDGGVAFWELQLDGKPVATLFGFVYRRRLVVHTISFDVDYGKYHCGLYCILSVMRTLRAQGIEWVDFSRGAERFKFYFADQVAVSDEFHWPVSWKAQVHVRPYVAAKDLARSWAVAGRVARWLGHNVEEAAPAGLVEGEEWRRERKDGEAERLGRHSVPRSR